MPDCNRAFHTLNRMLLKLHNSRFGYSSRSFRIVKTRPFRLIFQPETIFQAIALCVRFHLQKDEFSQVLNAIAKQKKAIVENLNRHSAKHSNLQKNHLIQISTHKVMELLTLFSHQLSSQTYFPIYKLLVLRYEEDFTQMSVNFGQCFFCQRMILSKNISFV